METLWIAFAYGLGLLCRWLNLPTLIGYLAARFLLNALEYEGGIVLAEIAHIGVLLLLFTVGLKLRLRNIFRPEVWGAGSMQIVVTCLLFVPIVIYLLGLTWPVALAMTIVFSFSMNEREHI